VTDESIKIHHAIERFFAADTEHRLAAGESDRAGERLARAAVTVGEAREALAALALREPTGERLFRFGSCVVRVARPAYNLSVVDVLAVEDLK
jgi:hypothetical protein